MSLPYRLTPYSNSLINRFSANQRSRARFAPSATHRTDADDSDRAKQEAPRLAARDGFEINSLELEQDDEEKSQRQQQDDRGDSSGKRIQDPAQHVGHLSAFWWFDLAVLLLVISVT